MKRTWIGKALVTGASGLTLLMAGAVAEASVTITISQQGDTVLATGSGTLDTHDLAYYSTFAGDAPGVAPEYAVIALGPLDISSDYYDGGVSGPLSFGGGDAVSASTGSGDFFEVAGQQEILTPAGYVSGAGLSGSATFSDTTIGLARTDPRNLCLCLGRRRSRRQPDCPDRRRARTRDLGPHCARLRRSRRPGPSDTPRGPCRVRVGSGAGRRIFFGAAFSYRHGNERKSADVCRSEWRHRTAAAPSRRA